ncbi:cytochrome b/b6 domain-containing protein [Hyphomonas sp.]|uniref:cytochrome b/b6 domain-containing protein n=1 Tax=Hyphomonas sp. TaxID=87 RepID=UPI003340A706
MSAAASSRYTGIAIALHWAMAASLAFMIWLGWNMDENEARYQLHKSIGITILFLALARLAWRFANPPPPLPEGMPALEKTASHVVHIAFYALMIGIPLGGWFMVSVSPFQISTVLYGVLSWPHLPFTEGLIGKDLYEIVAFVHGKGAWAIIALLALHVAGAIKHEFGPEEGVFKRMIPGLFGKANPPALPARGVLFAFGGSLALFGVIAATALIGAGTASSAAPPASAGGPSAAIASNWMVDYEASEIAFAGLHDGNAFKGEFETWTADVAFDPGALDAARVRVLVDMRSAKTGKKLYDDSLRAREWFSTADHPEAIVELSGFTRSANGYQASATLTLKGKPVSVPLRFTLEIDGDEAKLDGSAVFSRKALDIGQASDASASWVADEVTVTVSGRANRKP